MPWSLDICSTQCSPVHRVRMHGISNRGTHLHLPHNNSSFNRTTTCMCGVLDGSQVECGVVGEHYGTPYFYPRHRNPPSQEHSGSGLIASHLCRMFLLLLTKQIGYGPFCGLWVWRKRTANRRHDVLNCSIHQPPQHGLHGLTVLDDEIIEWLLNTCTEI